MGLEISKSSYGNKDFNQFYYKLEKETLLLQQWLKEGLFEDSGYSTGVELEAWIADSQYQPSPTNDWLLKNLSHPLVVPELSKFNIEINGSPQALQAQTFSKIMSELNVLWQLCEQRAKEMNSHLFMIGTLPTLKKENLVLKNMTPYERYKALNTQLVKNLNGQNFKIVIKGKDILKSSEKDIMMAAATTSFQIQWKIPASQYNRFFNTSQILSPVMVALTANSPYVFGYELWQESRVPLFEHAITSAPSINKENKRRAFFASGYIEKNVAELFRENLTQFPVLLPANLNSPLESLSHLNLHNGTIWRWVRPIIGESSNGQPHLRLEFRVPAAGPTIIDSISSMAFYMGLTYKLAQEPIPLEMQIPFYLTERNFYNCAKKGLKSDIHWCMGQKRDLKSLILEELLTKAEDGLSQIGIPREQIQAYLKNIEGRTQTQQTGAGWQIAFIDKYGKDFQQMAQVYHQNQNSEIPVHLWKI